MELRYYDIPDSKVHGANMGPIWGQQDPGGPHVDPTNFVILDIYFTVGIPKLNVNDSLTNHGINGYFHLWKSWVW